MFPFTIVLDIYGIRKYSKRKKELKESRKKEKFSADFELTNHETELTSHPIRSYTSNDNEIVNKIVFCPNCGNQDMSGSKYCMSCGAKLK